MLSRRQIERRQSEPEIAPAAFDQRGLSPTRRRVIAIVVHVLLREAANCIPSVRHRRFACWPMGDCQLTFAGGSM